MPLRCVSFVFPALRNSLICLAASLAVSGCGSFRQQITDLGPTLADLPDAEVPEVLEPVAIVPRAEIEAMYRSALSVAEDPDLRHQIQIRLADIKMARSEEAQLTSEQGGQFFNETIDMYDQLIQLQTEQAGAADERLLYRVSKAYALDARMGESDERLAALVAANPDSAFAAEAQFRRAELAFGQQDYRKAHELYSAVVEFGEDTPFYLNAIYMQGWSQFKQDRYQQALQPFGVVMDRLLPPGTAMTDLSSSQQSLLADTLKVMGFSFSYLEGAASIAQFADQYGEREYQHLVYRQLGDLYLEKKRYRDAANTYSAFVERYPDSPFSPELAVKTIDVYMQGNFPKDVLPAKEAYIARFGLTSSYWQARTSEQRQAYLGTLETYLDEVSSYYHAEAQALAAAQKRYQTGAVKKAPEAPEPYFLKAAS
ncbi:MAG TPA: tetratricopeptide repeat protein, partial [Marinagarivorans sp.]